MCPIIKDSSQLIYKIDRIVIKIININNKLGIDSVSLLDNLDQIKGISLSLNLDLRGFVQDIIRTIDNILDIKTNMLSEADLANALREKYYDAYVTISEIQNRIVVVKDNLFTPRKYSLELKKLVDLCKNFEEYCINSIKRIEEKLDHERTADAINEFLSIADEPLEVIPIQPAEEKTDILILSEMEFTAIKETHKASGKQKTSKAKESAPKKPPAKGKATKQVEFKKDKAVKTPDSSDASRSKDGKK